MNPLLNHLWQSTLFAAIAALLALALRNNSAQVRYRIWLIASLKFLIPLSLLVGIGSHVQVSIPAATPAFTAAMKQIQKPVVVATDFSYLSGSNLPTAATRIGAILFTIWIFGSLAVLASWFRQWLRVRAIVRAAIRIPLEAPIPALSCSSLLEPGVFGVFRPVLLLPGGITEHLTHEHLEAILAHELCHVRRRDNLAAAIHMLIEALFWFHPLVWWIGARLVDERERACDEEVLRLGKRPGLYAECILKTCQFYLESPLACVSGVTGSDLKKRVVRIMTGHAAVRLNVSKRLLLACAGLIAIALPLGIGLSRAQSTSAGASFEAASIKPTKPGTRGPMMRFQPGGKFSATGINVKFLLEEAYDVKDSQVSQAPPWLESDRFDIDAKPEDAFGAAMDKLPPEQRKAKLMQMVQNLLAERFKLELGHETKELPIYALVIAKSGSKLKEFKPVDKAEAGSPSPSRLMIDGPGHLNASAVDLSAFANLLSRFAGRAVIDKTGLTGRYDFTLQWNDEGQGFQGGPREPAAGAPTEASGPSLFTAIQEQLGLKLESQKAPMDVLVIKHVERPSEN